MKPILIILALVAASCAENDGSSSTVMPAEENKALFVKNETLTIANLVWEPLEVPGFPLGMKIALVDGDPSLADKPYTFRIDWPDGCQLTSARLTLQQPVHQLGTKSTPYLDLAVFPAFQSI